MDNCLKFNKKWYEKDGPQNLDYQEKPFKPNLRLELLKIMMMQTNSHNSVIFQNKLNSQKEKKDSL